MSRFPFGPMNTDQSFDRESFQSLLANAFSVQQSGMTPESLAAIIEIQRVVAGAGSKPTTP